MKNTYELVLVLKVTADNKEFDKVIEEINKIIKNGGKIIKNEDLGKKILAYQIKKETEANYRMLTLEMLSEHVKELSAKLKTNESVLRSLILKFKEKKVKQKTVKTKE
jgi:small subunit ribosomal protein S6